MIRFGEDFKHYTFLRNDLLAVKCRVLYHLGLEQFGNIGFRIFGGKN